MHDVPSGDRSKDISGRTATLQNSPESGHVYVIRVTAPTGVVRLYDLPRRTRSRNQFPECGAYAAKRRTAKRVAKEIRLEGRRVHSAANASDDQYRSRLLQVPQRESG